jgi:hypothetical protein
MSESLSNLIDRLRPQLPQTPTKQPMVVEDRETGTVAIVAPLIKPEISASGNDLYLRLSGRYVQAGRPNANGAFWTTESLAFGLPSVAGGPVNYLHDERTVLGAITGSRLVRPHPEQASTWYGDHIEVDMVLWKWLRAPLVAQVELAAQQDRLWTSMECISDTVTCLSDRETGREGCGHTFPMQDPCDHIRQKTSLRRFDHPVFLGGGLIVPPVSPGWKDAKLSIVSRDTRSAPVRSVTGLAEAASMNTTIHYVFDGQVEKGLR